MSDLERALLVAEKAHANQSYDIYPYMYHIRMVVEIAQEIGFEANIVVACALHDVLEDSDLSFNDIKRHFGQMVADIVYNVTDEMGKNRKERKERTYSKIASSWRSCAVKICDRIANVRHSALHNRKMFNLYKDEEEDFKRWLYCAPTLVGNKARAWELLEKELKN